MYFRQALFFLLFFGLPHSQWVLMKYNINAEAVPLGVMNWLLIVSFLLWVMGKGKGIRLRNPFKSYELFLVIVFLGTGIGFITGFEKDYMENLTVAKRTITLMLLYFVPISMIKGDREFLMLFTICLFVHCLIGIEVFRSGILGGSAFHDGKRGAAPFSWGWQGSDIAGSYLAQALMFFLGVIFTWRVSLLAKILCGIGGTCVFVGVLSTYGRGALLACAMGLVMILIFIGLRLRFILLGLMLIGIFIVFMPESVKTRFDATEKESGGLDQSSQMRFTYYRSAIEIIMDYPMGIGTGNIRSAMERYTRGGSQYIGKGIYADPHNSFLYTVCEYGVIGLFVFVWFLWGLLRGAREGWKSKKAPIVYKAYALSMGGMLGAFFGCNMFYANFYKELVLGTIAIHFGMLAYVVAMTRESEALEVEEALSEGGKGNMA